MVFNLMTMCDELISKATMKLYCGISNIQFYAESAKTFPN